MPPPHLTLGGSSLIIAMDTNIAVFSYNGNPVTFDTEAGLMVNATEMAKPFGKMAKDWLNNKSTKHFINTLSAVRTIPLTGLVVVKQGGNGEQGTSACADTGFPLFRQV